MPSTALKPCEFFSRAFVSLTPNHFILSSFLLSVRSVFSSLLLGRASAGAERAHSFCPPPLFLCFPSESFLGFSKFFSSVLSSGLCSDSAKMAKTRAKAGCGSGARSALLRRASMQHVKGRPASGPAHAHACECLLLVTPFPAKVCSAPKLPPVSRLAPHRHFVWKTSFRRIFQVAFKN